MKITEAKLYFNQNQTPTSADFDDVYFSNEDGLKETDYVFLSGNRLFERWESHQHASFHIAETGFGTGLNFFRTMQLFTYFRICHPKHQLKHLFFTSTEKYPLAKSDIEKIYHLWLSANKFNLEFTDIISNIDLQAFELSEQYLKQSLSEFLSQYPIAIEGLHRHCFARNETLATSAKLPAQVTLDLHYGDALDTFTNLSFCKEACVDAWFLDGFSPTKNTGLWQVELFNQLIVLSKLHTSFATFTAAGFVKRGLQAAGFSVRKRKGFGKKREMLVGVLEDKQKSELLNEKQAPYYIREGLSIKASKDRKAELSIAVVGSGLAGAMLAQKLCSRGIKMELLWQASLPADAASGNPLGGFYPQLNAQHNIASQVQLYSFLYAKRYYENLAKSVHFDHAWCGALQLAFNQNTHERLKKLSEHELWPKALAQLITKEEATKIAHLELAEPALYLPLAGWISPPSLTKACLQDAQASGLLTLTSNTKLFSYRSENQGVEATFTLQEDKVTRHYDALILALGSGLQAFTQDIIPLRLTRGQVEMVKTKAPFSALQTLLCHKGYFTPAVDSFHALGSTYVKNDLSTDVRQAETQANFNTHIKSIGEVHWQEALNTTREQSENFARAAIRCSTPDHLPIVGQMPSKAQFEELADLYKALPLHHYPSPSHQANVFVLSGLGSRGLTTAPLMAELLVSQILHEPLPINRILADALQPNRFIVRSLIRRQALHS